MKIARIVDRTAMYYYHTDALGSTRMITYNDATYVFVNNYQPFGKDNGTPKGSLANTEKDRFTGKPYSVPTGLCYFYQRWYDPSIGRFTSQDSVAGDLNNPQSLNRYIYVLDSPTSYTDPTGRAAYLTSSTQSSHCSEFWKDPWGSIVCHFVGTAPVAGVQGRGQPASGGVGPGVGAAANPVGIIIVAALWGYWFDTHRDQLFGHKDTSPTFPGLPKTPGPVQPGNSVGDTPSRLSRRYQL